MPDKLDDRFIARTKDWDFPTAQLLLRELDIAARAYIIGARPVVGIDQAIAQFEIVENFLEDGLTYEGLEIDSFLYWYLADEDEREEYWEVVVGQFLFGASLSDSVGICSRAAKRALKQARENFKRENAGR